MEVPYEKVFVELSKQKIEYLVAGGFAVNFHQVQRATVDLDLILRIEKANLEKFINIMSKLGFGPRVPVDPKDFCDEKIRRKWIQEKGMMVFSFIHKKNPFENIDVFSEEPIAFQTLWKERITVKAFGVNIPVIGKKHLIKLKTKSDREKDRFDIAQLKKQTD